MKYLNLIIKLSFFALLISWILVPAKVEMQSIEAQNSNKVRKIHLDDVHRIAYSPEGNIFAASYGRGEVRLFDTKTWTVLHELNHPDAAFRPTFSPDSKILVTGTAELAKGGLRNSKTWFWNVETGENIYVYEDGNVKEPIAAVAFSTDGKMMAWGNSDGRIRLVNVEDVKNLKITNEQLGIRKRREISSMSFSPDGLLLAVGSQSATRFTVFEVNTGNEVFSFDFKDSGILFVYNVRFSPDGKTLAVAGKFGKAQSWEYTVRLFNTDKWEMTADMRNHDGTVGLDFTPNGDSLVAVSPRKVDVIDLRTKKSVKIIDYQGEFYLHTSAISADGKSIAISGIMDDFISIYPIEVKQSKLLNNKNE